MIRAAAVLAVCVARGVGQDLCDAGAPVDGGGGPGRSVDALFASFAEWLEGRGGWVSPSVHLVADRRSGRALRARAELASDERIAYIPHGAMLGGRLYRALAADGVLPGAASGSTSPTADMLSKVALVLLWAKQADAARWQPYLDLLPGLDDYASVGFLFSEGEAACLPAVAQCGLALKQRALSDLSGRLEGRAFAGAPAWTAEDVRWAYTTASTRALETLNALVPMFDMMNHAPDSAVRLEVSKAGMTILARRALPEGAEVTVTYGTKFPHDFLVNYGFVDGAAERVPVPIPVGDALEELGCGEASELAVDRAGVPTDTLVQCAVLAAVGFDPADGHAARADVFTTHRCCGLALIFDTIAELHARATAPCALDPSPAAVAVTELNELQAGAYALALQWLSADRAAGRCHAQGAGACAL